MSLLEVLDMRNYTSLSEWTKLYKIEAARALRSYSPCDDLSEESDIRNALAECIERWHPAPPGREAFDNAVKALIQAALDETARTHIACPGAPTLCGMTPGPGVLAYDFCSLTEDASAWCPECWKEANKDAPPPQPSAFAGLIPRDSLIEAEELLAQLVDAPADLDWQVAWGLDQDGGIGPWVIHSELIICDLRRNGDGKIPSPGVLLSDDIDALLLASSSKLLGVIRRLVEELKRHRATTLEPE